MPKPRSRHSGKSDRDRHSGREGHHEFEHDEGNRAHIEIEERRFRGGLSPTPELYERAREQWNRLPGAVKKSAPKPVKPPVDSESKQAGAVGDEDEKESSR
jgi:hypothetical protein